ncbi:MAG: hypothetical protein VSS75_030380 [Candidatus Parabeggiatoa sp.]|nr:hypothetical protein [Candidatus Parabeggiatoa sp.]
MLLKIEPHSPFDTPCTQRLICLETKLRRKSDSNITVSEYQSFLEESEIKKIPSLRTLQEDFRRYARYCDDVIYGNHAKQLRLDPDAIEDAIIWLLDRAWLDSPLRPRISSACVRCLLLAKELNAEVSINYRPLRKAGEPWIPKTIVGIPIRALPGTDSGYFQLHLANGRLMNINLSRVLRFINFTEQSTDHYVAFTPQRQFSLTLEVQDRYLLERLLAQFVGLEKQGEHCATMVIEESLRTMTVNMLQGHLERTKSVQRKLPDKATMKINENVSIHLDEIK